MRKAHSVALLLIIVGIGALCSGCFVVRHEQLSRPTGPTESVTFHAIAAGFKTYSRVLEATNATVEVSVANWPSGWELQFLLNVIPISRYHYGRTGTEPLSVEVDVEPKTSGLVLDPRQIFFVGADHARLRPAKVRVLGSSEPSTGEAVPITERRIFHLEFPVEHRAYPERDLPFELSVEGLSVASLSIPLPPIVFEPDIVTRPAFRLPY